MNYGEKNDERKKFSLSKSVNLSTFEIDSLSNKRSVARILFLQVNAIYSLFLNC